MPAQVEDDKLEAAFRDLHGPRLHGFALLVALGEVEVAERAAGEALAAGGQQAAELSHPDRAAAWLRAHAVRGLHQSIGRGPATAAAVRRAAVQSIGVDDVVYEGLTALTVEGRAALIASAIEHFEAEDTQTILGASPTAARRIIARALARYIEVVGAQPGDPSASGPASQGLLARRIREVAARAMAPGWEPE